MASVEALECNGGSKPSISYFNDVPKSVGIPNFQKGEDVEDQVLHDMELLLEDVDDRLIISRMVTDAVIKGIVTALSQENAEIVAAKEREVLGLSKVLCSHQSNFGEFNKSEIKVCGDIGQGLSEEHQVRLGNVDNVLAFIDRCKEISHLRRELDSIRKSFISFEVGHLSPQGSLDADIFHRKLFTNHDVHPGGISNGNGKLEESDKCMPENFEKSTLTHMSKHDLYQHFRSEIIMMKRNHESIVQKETEKYFQLKREVLKERELSKERGPLAARKDKEFESLKKKMTEVISRLDVILKDNEKVSEFCNHSRDTLDSILSENCRLRDLLDSKKLEASNAEEKLEQRVIVEKKLQRSVGNLSVSLADAFIEAFISEQVHKTIIREIVSQQKSINEDSDLASLIYQEIIRTIYEQAFNEVNTGNESTYGETSALMSDLMEQVHSIVFKELIADMSTELNELNNKCVKQDENLLYLETKVSKVEKDFYMEVEENKKVKHQVLVFENTIKDKDKYMDEVTKDLHKLSDLRTQYENLIADRDEELVLLKEKLEESQNCVDMYMSKVGELNDALLLLESRLRKSDEEKDRIAVAFQNQQNDLDFAKLKDSDHKKMMQSFCCGIDGLLQSIADIELRTKERLGWQSARLENSAFQLRSLVPKVNILRRTSLLYKERMEKRTSDLQKAEAEVDVLGDEVDTLLRLLEKIYVALDHYSPILQHYPGIIEILKLVKRELSPEGAKVL